MRRISRHWLAGLVLLLPFTACATAYDVTIRAQNADTLVGFFVVVAPEDQLKGYGDPEKLAALVQPSAHSNYLVFAQYASEKKDGEYQLAMSLEEPSNGLVEITRSDDWTEQYISIDRSLEETTGADLILFVANFRDGYKSRAISGREVTQQKGAVVSLGRDVIQIEKVD